MRRHSTNPRGDAASPPPAARSRRPAAMFTFALACFVVALPGCLHATRTERFRSPAGEGALQRAAASVASHCGGVQQVDEALGLIHGRWQDAQHNIGFSWIFYRCVVTVLPERSDGSADVRVSMQSVLCGPIDSLDPAKKAAGCAPHPKVPSSVREHFERAVEGLREDIVRR